jgi:hypothetical protein
MAKGKPPVGTEQAGTGRAADPSYGRTLEDTVLEDTVWINMDEILEAIEVTGPDAARSGPGGQPDPALPGDQP